MPLQLFVKFARFAVEACILLGESLNQGRFNRESSESTRIRSEAMSRTGMSQIDSLPGLMPLQLFVKFARFAVEACILLGESLNQGRFNRESSESTRIRSEAMSRTGMSQIDSLPGLMPLQLFVKFARFAVEACILLGESLNQGRFNRESSESTRIRSSAILRWISRIRG